MENIIDEVKTVSQWEHEGLKKYIGKHFVCVSDCGSVELDELNNGTIITLDHVDKNGYGVFTSVEHGINEVFLVSYSRIKLLN